MKNEIVKEFNYNGYDCEIRKIGFGFDIGISDMCSEWHCGYITILKNHKCLNNITDYQEIDIECHGGITFGENINDKEYKLGFDCNHGGDSMDYWDISKVTNEIKSICDQLKTIQTEK